VSSCALVMLVKEYHNTEHVEIWADIVGLIYSF